jgi:hypothetical protein
MERIYRWFVHCLDKFTNDRVCDSFGIHPDSMTTSDRVFIGQEVVYSEGRKRKVNLIELSSDQKNILLKSAKEHQFQFELFSQEGKGQIRFCPKKFAAGKPMYDDVVLPVDLK